MDTMKVLVYFCYCENSESRTKSIIYKVIKELCSMGYTVAGFLEEVTEDGEMGINGFNIIIKLLREQSIQGIIVYRHGMLSDDKDNRADFSQYIEAEGGFVKYYKEISGNKIDIINLTLF